MHRASMSRPKLFSRSLHCRFTEAGPPWERSITAEDIDYVIERLEPLVGKLRQALPVGAG